MYVGKMMELAPSREIYKNPLNPYTKALMSANPIPDPDVESARARMNLPGEVPSPINPPVGCRFAGRCPQVMEECKHNDPELKQIEAGHWVSCFLYK
jgi:oligopeptide transport system ATP-binding protein